MIVNLSKTASHANWQNDLEIGMSLIGSYKMQTMQNDLMKAINVLIDILNHYQGANAFRLDKVQCPEEYIVGLKVTHWQAGFPFQGYVKFNLDNNNRLVGVLHYTAHEPKEDDSPTKRRKWQTTIFTTPPSEMSGAIVTEMKNRLIQYLTEQVLGDAIVCKIED